MPRSKNSNWASRQRLAFIEDTLLSVGYVNREALQSYFGLERSLGSMDITAYQKAGGILRKAKAGEVMPDGTVVRGYKLGGRLLYVAGDGFEPVMGSTEARREAWGLLPMSLGEGHNNWLASVMSAYVADRGADGAAEYFGISEKEASGINRAYPEKAERAKIWELFR